MRSVSAEIELEKGEYDVIPKICAHRDSSQSFVEDVVKKYAESNPQKLRQIGINHDVANAKGLELKDLQDLDDMQKKAAAKAQGKSYKEEKTEKKDPAVTDATQPSKDAPVQETAKKATEEKDSADTAPVEPSVGGKSHIILDYNIEGSH
jgi:hypothetical protein